MSPDEKVNPILRGGSSTLREISSMPYLAFSIDGLPAGDAEVEEEKKSGNRESLEVLGMAVLEESSGLSFASD